MRSTFLSALRELMKRKRTTRCAFTALFFVLTAFPVKSQIDQEIDWYAKSRRILDSLCGEKYIPLKTSIYHRKRKPNDNELMRSAIETCEKARKQAGSKKRKKAAELSVTLGDLYYDQMELPKAEASYLKALRGFKKLNLIRGRAISEYKLGLVYKETGELDKAIRLFVKVYDYFDREDELSVMANLEYNMGAINWRLEHPEKATSHFEKCYEIAEKAKDTFYMSSGLEGIASVHASRGDRRKSLEYYIQAKNLCTQSGDQLSLVGILFNIGVMYRELGNHAVALDYFLLSLENAEAANDSFNKCLVLTEIAKIKMNQGSYAESEQYSLEAFRMAGKMENLDFISRASQGLSTLYEKMGKHNKALSYYKKSINAENEILNRKSLEALADSEMKYKAYKAESDKKQTEYKLKSNKEILALTKRLNSQANYKVYALTITVVSAIVLLIFGIVYHRLRNAKRDLGEKHTQLCHQEEKRQLEKDLESQKREAMDMASMLTYKNEFIDKVVQQIGHLLSVTNPDEIKSKLVELRFELVRHKKSSSEFNRIAENIERGQHEFYEKMRAINPSISKKELLIASLVKLEVETKEIAGILGVSGKSIRMYKYRLKKKLALDEETDLREFIQSL